MNHELSEAEAESRIGADSFTAGRPRRIGVELEWLVRPADDPRELVGRTRSDTVISPLEASGPLPGGGLITREPGGQVELSSLPTAGLAGLVERVETDRALLRRELAAGGLVLDGTGLDDRPAPPRIVDTPRYRAMEARFDGNPAGSAMMCATASIQINLEAGDRFGPFGYRRRWVLAHRLGPVLIGAFANSPVMDGKATGWKSTRQAIWTLLDPGRTHPAADGDNPRKTWTRYALDAPLLCVRRPEPHEWTVPPGLTFRSWLRGTGERKPTLDDLRYHLGTLFPPVRPRGWLELRMIDAQPGAWWTVPAALCWALFEDAEASAAAWNATEPLTDADGLPAWPTWRLAARTGIQEPALRTAAQTCFAAAARALERTEVPDQVREALSEYNDRFTARGRCPADDRLAHVRNLPDGAASIDLEEHPTEEEEVAS